MLKMAELRRVMLLCIFLSAVFGISEQLNQDINNNNVNPDVEQHQNAIHQHVQRPNIRLAPLKIADHPACLADVKALCSPKHTLNNFAVLECLQSDEEVGEYSRPRHVPCL